MPGEFSQLFFEVVRVVVAVEFDFAGLGMSFVVSRTLTHEVAFVELVKNDIEIFGRNQIVVDPNLFLGNPRVDQMMTPVHEVQKKSTSN